MHSHAHLGLLGLPVLGAACSSQPPCTSFMSVRPYAGGEAPASSGRAAERRTSSTPTRGWCNSTACVSLRRHGTVLADTVFVPLCGTRQQGPKVSTVFLPNEELGRRWQQMEVPIELFDGPYARRRSQLDELVVVPRGEMLEMDAGGGELEGGEGGELGRRRRRQQRRARHVAQGLLPLEPPLVVYLDEVRLSA